MDIKEGRIKRGWSWLLQIHTTTTNSQICLFKKKKLCTYLNYLKLSSCINLVVLHKNRPLQTKFWQWRFFLNAYVLSKAASGNPPTFFCASKKANARVWACITNNYFCVCERVLCVRDCISLHFGVTVTQMKLNLLSWYLFFFPRINFFLVYLCYEWLNSYYNFTDGSWCGDQEQKIWRDFIFAQNG